jgi:hypothetical protein
LTVLAAACGADPSDSGSGGRGSTDPFGNSQQGSGSAASTPGGFGNPNGTPASMAGSSSSMVGGTNSCARADVTATRVTPSVMLVVDGSTSMEMAYGMSTRWLAIRDALVSPTGVVTQLEGVVKFGLALFGTIPACPLPFGILDPALMNLGAITNGLPAIAPGLTTPTGLALDMVVDRLPDPSMALDVDVGPQIIVLATDGDPNDCLLPIPNTVPSIDAAKKGAAKHLKMYVISVGQDASAVHLQEMANIGAGMDQFANPGATVYYPEDPAALSATLQSLIGQAVGCTVRLEGRGVRLGAECRGEVTLNGFPLECNGADGWKLIDETHIELQGTSCQTFMNDAAASLHANFPCDVLVD